MSARQLLEEVKSGQKWGDATIKTLLNRLLHKGAIRSEQTPERHQYRAVLEREAYVAGEVQALVDRLFEGRPELLLAYLSGKASSGDGAS
jgi:predicted transcriptional regulator